MSNITTTSDSIESPGDNIIEGSVHNDLLVGTDGDDQIIGYVGIDTLTGGDGSDVFILGDENGSFYNTKEWQDFATITDFIVGEDSILLTGTSADYSFTQHESGQAWIFDNGDFVAAVNNTAVQDLTSSLVFLGGEPPVSEPPTTEPPTTEPPTTEPPTTEPPTTEPPTSDGVIEGNSDNNDLMGTDGDDRLIGYSGIDTLTGGDGNDVFVLGDENGSFYNTKEWQDFTTITDFTVGEDSILLTGTSADYSFTQHGSGQAWIFDNGDFVAAVNNTAVQDLTSSLVFLGGEPPVSEPPTTEPPTTEPPTTEPPTTEPPTTEPPTSDGVIEGNSDNNDLMGTDGDDRLIGYSGIDTLTGGDGNDVFVLGDENGSFYNTKEWQDFTTITDFTVGEDTILLTGTSADYSFTQHGSGQAWIFDNGDFVAAVNNTAVQDLTSGLIFLDGEPPVSEPPTTEPPTTEPPTTEPPTTEPPTSDGVIEGDSDNNDLMGTAGDDRLIGYGGIDTLTGGDGNDVFVLGDENGSFYNTKEWQDFATITDFTVGEDTILLTGTSADYSFTQHESGQAWIFDNGDFVAAVDNTTVQDLTSGLIFLDGEPPTTEPPTTEPPTTEPPNTEPPTTEPPTTEPPNIPPPTLEGVIEITAIGDSITQAGTGFNSYRSTLWHQLTDAGYTVDFVGSQNATNDGSAFPDSSFDPDHEGHWGWRTDEINNGRGSEGSLSDWLTEYTPDIALIHLGTNDLFHHQSAESTIDELRETIAILRADKPNVVVFLAQLIPTTDSGRNARIEEFNAQIPALVAEANQTNSPVILVDQNSGFNASQDTFDGIHPTAAGEAKMAQRWFDAINSYLTSNGITPDPGSEPPTTEPPATEPPTAEPPTTEPPATEPPTTEPPADGVIEGSANNDELVGTDGDDRLIGYVGIDTLTGGDGSDVFVLGDANGSFYDVKEWQDFTRITDFTVGEDTILLTGTSADYSFSTEGHETWIFKNGDFVATLHNTAGQDVTHSLEFLGGEAPANDPPANDPPATEPPIIKPPAPVLPVPEPPSADGVNVIEGSSHNDVLVGTDGSDRLIGHVGIDELTGGAGNDVFVLGDENGSFYDVKEWQDFAKITDFTVGEDTILVTGSRDNHSFITEGHQTWIFNNGDFIATLYNTAGQDVASSLAFIS